MSDQDKQRVPSSSYMMDAENVAEMARLIRNARALSQLIGLAPAEIALAERHRLLDIACGPGAWVLEVAERFPTAHVTGIDISEPMLAYATLTAQQQQLSQVQFQQMDATRPLDFADASFDFIHARLIEGFLTTEGWSALLAECVRLLRPGGVLCTVEVDNMGSNTSPALTRYNSLFIQAMRQAGKCFTASGDALGILAVQARLLQQAGLRNVHSRAHVLNYSVGMPMYQTGYENFATMMHLLQPLLLHFHLATQEELAQLTAQALEEMSEPTFCGVMLFQSVWGEKPA